MPMAMPANPGQPKALMLPHLRRHARAAEAAPAVRPPLPLPNTHISRPTSLIT